MTRLAALLVALLVAGCAGTGDASEAADASAPQLASQPTDAARAPPIAGTVYQRMGGAPAVERFVDAVIARSIADPKVAPLFKDTDVPYFRARLIEQVCEATGGGCEYTGLPMDEAHSGMAITDAEFDHFAGMAREALRDAAVPDDAAGEVMTFLGSLRGDVTNQ
jgi:hemoglobin